MDSAKWGNAGGRGIETERGFRFRCKRHAGPLVAGLLSIFAFVSPILMVGLPKMNFGLVELSEKKENEVHIKLIYLASYLLIHFTQIFINWIVRLSSLFNIFRSVSG